MIIFFVANYDMHEIYVYFFYAIWGMAGLEINLWRSWQAAISLGEEHASFEPGIAEWDSYYFLSSDDPLFGDWEPAELKHLSRQRKRKQLWCR